jgi:hypothetical protein
MGASHLKAAVEIWKSGDSRRFRGMVSVDESSSTLEPADWTAGTTVVPEQSSVVQVIDENVTGRRFFRLRRMFP